MIKCLLWVSGNCLSENFSVCHKISNDNTEIMGFTTFSENAFFKTYAGFHCYDINEIEFLNPDIVVVFEHDEKFAYDISKLLQGKGIDEWKIINYQIFNRYGFDLNKYLEVKKHTPSIFSPNCWGGITYNYLKLQFTSPLINMFESRSDFLKLMCNLKHYMNCELSLKSMVYDKNLKHDFPVIGCDDITLYCNHYKTFEEASSSWERRKSRINYDNIFVMFFCETQNEVDDFLKIPYDNKICFINFKSSSIRSNHNVIYINYKDSSKLKDLYFWQVIINMSKGVYICYDIFSLLTHSNSSMPSMFGNT